MFATLFKARIIFPGSSR